MPDPEPNLPILPARWAGLSGPEFAALATGTTRDRVVAVLPVSATEQHGPHLPTAVDASINRGILDRALADLPPGTPVLTLPEQVVGHSPEHGRYPGTLTLSSDTTAALWRDIIDSVAQTGFRRLLIFNSHGGQGQIAQLIVREARTRLGMLAATVSWPDFGLPDDVVADGTVTPAEIQHGLHGGQLETAMILALDPGAVRQAMVADFPSAAKDMVSRYEWLHPEGAVRIGWRAEDLNPAGVTGDATAATAALGHRLLAHAANALKTLLIEMTDPVLSREWLDPG